MSTNPTPLAVAQQNTFAARKVAVLLFGSGMCALIYQMAWLREFRLVFGASTAASAAVLAIFMGGLGLGSLVLGGRADRQERPLGFYGRLEVLIALTAAVTPLLLWAVRKAYIATGGSPVLGLWAATGVRLMLAALVLLVPTFLMGGTLPAAARSVENEQDLGRRHLAFLYGLNTLGAVTGTLLATFFLLEMFGTRRTLWAACLVNALVAMAALSMSRRRETGRDTAAGGATTNDAIGETAAEVAGSGRPRRGEPRPVIEVAAPDDEPPVPAGFVLGAAAIVGFAFLLMELVWYRILSPILGGSTFTFGLILAVALLGIGLGGACYSIFRGNKPATLTGFALTCALEAVFIAIPFALGDRVAITAMLLRDLGSMGFLGLVGGWSIITSLAVLPAAFVSGLQFPLLIALLGRGRRAVGRHVGLAYAWNTVGAIVGSLAGGFGLMPLLTAPNTWRLVVVLLALLAVAALALALPAALRAALAANGNAGNGNAAPGLAVARRAWPAASAAALAVVLLLATGPTAAWRHGGIGAGRANNFDTHRNAIKQFIHNQRRTFVWEEEGVESSVGVEENSGYSFYVNGKCDGHSRDDAGTQVMAGLTGAILHGAPRTAMVIGLGTGSTAGWMGSVPSMERLDVIELEPAILHVAKMCAPANRDVLQNPKVHVTIGDAREALLTSRGRYDLIFSEPSNPYRAGVASLYTKEFYEAARDKLQPGGLFLQWVQAYEVDGQTLRTVYATAQSVFPSVETWQTQAGDLLLVAGAERLKYDAAALRERITQEPYRSALFSVWRVNTLEGFLAHHYANAKFAREVAKAHGEPLNTDDRTVVEFGFARSVGARTSLTAAHVLALARARKEERPEVAGEVDWEAVEDHRFLMEVYFGRFADLPPDSPQARKLRGGAMNLLLQGNASGAVQTWRQQPKPPTAFIELSMLGMALAEMGSVDAEPLIARVREMQETEGDALLANLRWRQHRPAEAALAMQSALVRYRSDPWVQRDLMRRTIALAVDVGLGDRGGNVARALYDALSTPFVLHLNEETRRRSQVAVANHLDSLTGSRLLPDALAKFEPFVPWDEPFLTIRAECYLKTNHPLLMQAARDLDEFRENNPFPFDYGLRPTPPAATQPATGPTTGPTTSPVHSPSGPWLQPDGGQGQFQVPSSSSGAGPQPAPPGSGGSGDPGSIGGGSAAPPPKR